MFSECSVAIHVQGNKDMQASVVFNNVLGALLLPPLNMILLCAAGLLLRPRMPRLGIALCALALIVLTVFSTTAGARLILAPLEEYSVPLASARATGAQAIVVLSGGRRSNAPEYGGKDVPSANELARLAYAATLHRHTGLPLLVTGGAPGGGEPEALAMQRSLQQDFQVPVKWVEAASGNTAENAAFSARILRQANVRKILLVTDGIHMPRSRAIFSMSGLDTIAAPTVFYSHERLSLFDFLPGGEGLRRSHYAMHEWIGLVWYRLRHGAPMPA